MAGIPTTGSVSADGSAAVLNATNNPLVTPSVYNLGNFGVVGALLGGLQDLTQEAVEEFLRNQVNSMLNNSLNWTNLLNLLWDGLDRLLAFPVALMKAFLEKLIPQELLDLLLPLINPLLEIAGWDDVPTVPDILGIVDQLGGWLWRSIRFLVTGFVTNAEIAGTMLQQLVKQITKYSIEDLVDDPLGTLNDFFKGVSAAEGPLVSQLVKNITGIDVNALGENPLGYLNTFFGGFVANAGTLLQQIVYKITGINIGNLGDPLTKLGDFFAGFNPNDGSLLDQIVARVTGIHLPSLPNINDLPEPLRDPLGLLGEFFSGFNVDVNNPTGFIPQIVDALTGSTGGLPDLSTWAGGVPQVSDLVTAITGNQNGGDITVLQDWAKNVPVITSLIPAITGDSEATDISALGIWAQNVLTGSSPIPAENLLGTVSQGLLASLPVSHINLANPNLLSQGSFNAAGTMNGEDGWEWDSTTNHYENANGGGSAKVSCNGTERKLYSNQAIPVIEGDRIELSGWIKTSSNFAGSNTSINLAVIPFAGSTPQPVVVLSNRGGSTNWVEFGTSLPWVVPAGVTTIKVRLAVTAAATAGTVWFDDIWCNKAGLMSQEFVNDLMEAWNQIWKGGYGLDAAVEVIGKTVYDLAEAVSNPVAVANFVGTTLSNFQTVLDTDPGSVIGTVTNGLGGVSVDGNITFESFISELGKAAVGAVDNFFRGAQDLINNLGVLLGISNGANIKGDTAITNNTLTNKAVYQGYYGVGGSGEIAEVQQVVEAIRTRLDGGYDLQTLTSNGYWRRPWFQPDVYALLHCDIDPALEMLPTSASDSSAVATPFMLSGGATFSTSEKKFGTSSLYFPGTSGSYVSRQAQRWMLTDDFTLEMWFKPTQYAATGKSASGLYYHASQINYGGYTNLSHGLALLSDGRPYYFVNKDYTSDPSASRTDIVSSTTANLNQWNHIAIVRNFNIITMYLNGVARGSANVGFSTVNSFASWGVEVIGSYHDQGVGEWPFYGHIDEVRLTKSAARYTAGFTPPTTKFIDRDVFGTPREFYAVAFGGGSGAGAGNRIMSPSKQAAWGGAAGAPGGYAALEFDASELPATVQYTIGAGGIGQTSATYPTGTNQSTFSFVDRTGITQSISTAENRFFVQTVLGYYSSSESSPGRGGDGGAGYNGADNGIMGRDGGWGGWSQLAAGGSPGSGGGLFGAPTRGANAANAPVTGKSRSGGGGGGGGGGAYTEYWGDIGHSYGMIFPVWGWGGWFGDPYTRPTYTGGLGGNGGFPGGGGGGGGGSFTWDIYGELPYSSSIPAGNGGNGANGIVILIWR